MKTLILILSLISANSFALDKVCAYSCAIAKMKPNGEWTLIVGNLMESEFKAIGGYTNDLNTSCMFNGTIDNIAVKGLVHDSFGYITQIEMSINGNSITAEGPGVSGKYSMAHGGYRMECFR